MLHWKTIAHMEEEKRIDATFHTSHVRFPETRTLCDRVDADWSLKSARIIAREASDDGACCNGQSNLDAALQNSMRNLLPNSTSDYRYRVKQFSFTVFKNLQTAKRVVSGKGHVPPKIRCEIPRVFSSKPTLGFFKRTYKRVGKAYSVLSTARG